MIHSVKSSLSLFRFGEYEKEILTSMLKINRKDFIPENYSYLAYSDNALPIGEMQTISQPSTVARMIQLLDIEKNSEILEIGTGSGWNAALLSRLGKSVLTLEINHNLAEKAKTKLLKYPNIEVREEDFRLLNQKFNKIIFTAGISENNEEIIKNFAEKCLNEKGILICPFSSGPLIIIKKENGKINKKYTQDEYAFVTLVL